MIITGTVLVSVSWIYDLLNQLKFIYKHILFPVFFMKNFIFLKKHRASLLFIFFPWPFIFPFFSKQPPSSPHDHSIFCKTYILYTRNYCFLLIFIQTKRWKLWPLLKLSSTKLQGYILCLLIISPLPSFTIHFFPPRNKFAVGGANFLDFKTQKDAFLRPFPQFLCNFFPLLIFLP